MPSYFSPCIADDDSACFDAASPATVWFAAPLPDADLPAVGWAARAPATSETVPIVSPSMAAPITTARSAKLSTHTEPLIVLVMDNFIGALLFSKFGLFNPKQVSIKKLKGA
jgi:hypothetical protein